MFARILLYSFLNALLIFLVAFVSALINGDPGADVGLVLMLVLPVWLLMAWGWIILAVVLRLNRFWAYTGPLLVLGLYLLLDISVFTGDVREWRGIILLFAIQYTYSNLVLNTIRQ